MNSSVVNSTTVSSLDSSTECAPPIIYEPEANYNWLMYLVYGCGGIGLGVLLLMLAQYLCEKWFEPKKNQLIMLSEVKRGSEAIDFENIAEIASTPTAETHGEIDEIPVVVAVESSSIEEILEAKKPEFPATSN